MIRAGMNGVSVEVLRRTASDSYDDHGYFGVSLFAAVDLDVDDVCRSIQPIASYSVIRTSTAGALRAAGFALLPTGRRPHSMPSCPTSPKPRSEDFAVCFEVPRSNPASR
jgi:hypothetical protein